MTCVPIGRSLCSFLVLWGFLFSLKMLKFKIISDLWSDCKNGTVNPHFRIFFCYCFRVPYMFRILTPYHKNALQTFSPIPRAVSSLRCLLEEQTQSDRLMKSCSASLIIREVWIETTMRCHPTPVGMFTTTRTSDNRCQRG